MSKLTDEKLIEVYALKCDCEGTRVMLTGLRAVAEAAVAAAREGQEPVAWYHPSGDGYDSNFRDHATVVACKANPWDGWVPLYTTPPTAPVAEEMQGIIDALSSMVEQHCKEADGVVYSGAISANADAILMLAKHGRMQLTKEPFGRIVHARWMKEQPK